MTGDPGDATPRPLADQRYWHTVHDGVGLSAAAPHDPLRRWIETHVPPACPGQACLEVGCYPGRYLGVLGRLGYELNGVDLSSDLDRMVTWLRSEQFRIGAIERADFFGHDSGRRFDVVLSLGFVEHFEDWPAVVERHAELVAEGGLLVMEAPNFRGAVQGWFHRRYDRESYRKHFLPAMDPLAWSRVLEPLGFDIVSSGNIGRLALWVEPEQRSLVDRLAVAAALRSTRILKHLLPADHPSWAPYSGLVARRR